MVNHRYTLSRNIYMFVFVHVYTLLHYSPAGLHIKEMSQRDPKNEGQQINL